MRESRPARRQLVLAIIKKEIRQLLRDRRTMIALIIVPLFMLMMFGYAISLDVKHIKLAVYDEDLSATSRQFLAAFINSGYFNLTVVLPNPRAADHAMASEECNVAFIIPHGFGNKLISGKAVNFQVLVDGANASMASTIIGYVNVITESYSAQITAEAFTRSVNTQLTDNQSDNQSGIRSDNSQSNNPSGSRSDNPNTEAFTNTASASSLSPVDTRYRIWFNPELQSAQFLVPGLIALIMVIAAVTSTALSIVKEKEHGSMEQLLVSPVTPWELVLGKTIPYFLFTLVVATGTLLVSFLAFGLTVKGSYILLALSIFIFLFGSLGMGILISTIADSQQVAFMLASLTTMLPTYILSGFVFPIRNMPFILQLITYLIPARYFIVILRSVMLRGAGWVAVAPELLGLAIFAAFTLSLGIFRLRRELERG